VCAPASWLVPLPWFSSPSVFVRHQRGDHRSVSLDSARPWFSLSPKFTGPIWFVHLLSSCCSWSAPNSIFCRGAALVSRSLSMSSVPINRSLVRATVDRLPSYPPEIFSARASRSVSSSRSSVHSERRSSIFSCPRFSSAQGLRFGLRSAVGINGHRPRLSPVQ
jgi:hypothetical protein